MILYIAQVVLMRHQLLLMLVGIVLVHLYVEGAFVEFSKLWLGFVSVVFRMPDWVDYGVFHVSFSNDAFFKTVLDVALRYVLIIKFNDLAILIKLLLLLGCEVLVIQFIKLTIRIKLRIRTIFQIILTSLKILSTCINWTVFVWTGQLRLLFKHLFYFMIIIWPLIFLDI